MRAVTPLPVHEDTWDQVRKVSDTSSTTLVGDSDARLDQPYPSNSPAQVFEDLPTPATSVRSDLGDQENNPPPSTSLNLKSNLHVPPETSPQKIIYSIERSPTRYVIWDPTTALSRNATSRASSEAPTVRLGSPFALNTDNRRRAVIKTEHGAGSWREASQHEVEFLERDPHRVPLTEVDLKKVRCL